MDKPQIYVHIEKNLNYNAFDIKWFPKSAKIVVIGSEAKGTGLLQVLEMCKGELKLILNIQRPKSIKCGTFAASSFEKRSIAIGDFNGNLEIIDFKAPNTPIYSVKAHNEIINCIDGVAGLNVGKGAPEIVTGSRDGYVKVWDPRQKDRPVVTIEPKDEKQKRDCWTVSFGNSHSIEDRIVCSGFDNGDLKMFDLRNLAVHWETNLKNGICSIEFDRKDIEMNKLIVTTLESKFHVFDLRTFHNEKGYSKSTEKYNKPTTIWSVKHLPQNREISMTTAGDGSVNLWKYSYPSSRTKVLDDKSKVGVCGSMNLLQNATLSSQPITGFDWNIDKQGLFACSSLDQTVRIAIVTRLNCV